MASTKKARRPKPAKKRTFRRRVGAADPKFKRMFKYVYNSLRDRGVPHADAERIAAATVNRHRREHGLLVEDVGRGRWYLGKPEVRGRSARAEQLLAEGDVERAGALLATPSCRRRR